MNTILSRILDKNHDPTRKEQILAVLSLAWPAIIEQIMITMVQYIDTAMVGSLGPSATAAIGVTSSTIWLFNGFLGAAGVGFSVQVAHHIGAGREDDARNVVRQAVLFNLCFGIFMMGLAVGLSYPLPAILGADASIAPIAGNYFRIVGYSIPFLLTINLFGSVLRCSGDTRTPMLLNLSLNLFDVIFNTLLIFPTRDVSIFGFRFTMWGAGLGVTGAALGTAISTVLVSLLMLFTIFRKQSLIRISFKGKYRFSKNCLKTTARLGIPAALERATLSVAQIVITMIISRLGTISIAANHLAVTAEALSYLPAYGVAAAATTLVGQALGAGKRELAMRFAKISTTIGMLIMTGTGVLLYLFAPPLISLFTSDPQTIALGARVLRVEAFAQPLFAASIVCSGALRGAGDSKGPFLINLVSMWGVRLTIAAVIAPKVGLIGVWIAMCAELCIRGIIFLIRLLKGKWLNAAHRLNAEQTS